MALLVSGHRGFIGKHLTNFLNLANIKWIGYDLVDGNDIRDKQKLDAFFERNQITDVIHLAALAGVRRGEQYVDDYVSTNIKGTHNLVELSEKYGVNHFVFFSSSSVYGKGNPPIKETHERNPVSIYGATKLFGELIVQNSDIKKRTIVVPFTVYGPDGRKDEVIYKWIEQYKNGLPCTFYGDGSSCRGYVNVFDLCEAVINILTNTGHWECERFNLGGAEIIKLQQLKDWFSEQVPNAQWKILPMPKGDVQKNWANTTKARDWFRFDPEKKFELNLIEILKKELYEGFV